MPCFLRNTPHFTPALTLCLQVKGYIWTFIPCLVLIRIQYIPPLAVCRTTPTTPGLSQTHILVDFHNSITLLYVFLQQRCSKNKRVVLVICPEVLEFSWLIFGGNISLNLLQPKPCHHLSVVGFWWILRDFWWLQLHRSNFSQTVIFQDCCWWKYIIS